MSSLWTPGGEHSIPDRPRGADAEPELSEEEAAAMGEAAAEIAQIREELAAAPPELVVANHVMGLYELAAIHLNRPEPDLAAARLAIDALAAVLDRCAGRLGEPEATLVGARQQLQMAYVQVAEHVKHKPAG